MVLLLKRADHKWTLHYVNDNITHHLQNILVKFANTKKLLFGIFRSFLATQDLLRNLAGWIFNKESLVILVIVLLQTILSIFAVTYG